MTTAGQTDSIQTSHHTQYAGKQRRDTLFLEDGEILSQTAWPGGQYVLRILAPKAARHATPGTFAHVSCDLAVRMRRPLSIMRADSQAGWLELLYKVMGDGLGKLARRRPGDRISLIAPIGRGFAPNPERPRIIGLGGGVGIPPLVFLADQLRHAAEFHPPLMLMGSELPFPFDAVESRLPIPCAPATASRALTLLEDWNIPSRLASNAGFDGVFQGHVPALARTLIESLDDRTLAETEIMACGPEPMLQATASLAADFDLPCQLAVEEYMACAVGGCAGCTVPVMTAEGLAMKRVCVDGPVFEAREIYPSLFSRN